MVVHVNHSERGFIQPGLNFPRFSSRLRLLRLLQLTQLWKGGGHLEDNGGSPDSVGLVLAQVEDVVHGLGQRGVETNQGHGLLGLGAIVGLGKSGFRAGTVEGQLEQS